MEGIDRPPHNTSQEDGRGRAQEESQLLDANVTQKLKGLGTEPKNNNSARQFFTISEQKL